MNRPYVICHMCTTIDGKILGNRWGKWPGGRGSAELFETTAASFKIGAWIVGPTTMKEFSGKPQKLARPKVTVPNGDFIAAGDATSFAIGIDNHAALRFQKSEVDGDHTVVLITEKAGPAYRAHLRDAGVSYLVCGSDSVNLKIAMRKIYGKLGIKKLMLEGGGKFNGSMLHAGLVDEISQVIVPVVDGGVGVSSIFDIGDPTPKKAAANLKVIKHQTLPSGVHWLRYRVV